ncbi:NAD-dependent epimerase/dehydratase family protein [Spirosoma pomorum]
MKTVLLTGANGFLGGHLCRELLRRGYAVRAFVRPDSDRRVLDDLSLDVWLGDLLDVDNVRAATYGCDYVIHAGASTQVNPARSEEVVKTNIEGTAAALAAAVESHVKRFVFVGTANVFGFGSKKKPGNECLPYMGERYGLDYMDSKRAATELVMQAAHEDKLPVVLVHPTFMIGPLDYKITSNALMLAIYRGAVLGTPMGGKNYIHVSDVATATVNALTEGGIGESYILGNQNLSYREAFSLMADVMRVRPPKLPALAPISYLIGQFSDWKYKLTGRKALLNSAMVAVANDTHYFNAAKAVKELHLPQTPVRIAMEEAFAWFQQQKYI